MIRRVRTCIRVAAGIAACAGGGVAVWAGGQHDHQPPAPTAVDDARTTDLARTIEVEGQQFDAVVTTPGSHAGQRWGVLLIGGGLANDLDWTTPGSLEIEGKSTQISISGEPHADAPFIASALAEKGFTVMRWSTIARGDPLADQWPLRATPRTFDELTRQARTALEDLRSTSIRPDRIILLGHSLGAARAITIATADPGVRALILLAPAEALASERTPKSLRDSGIKHLDEALARDDLTCLALFGGLDASRAVDRPAIERLALEQQDGSITIRIFDELGHQLGPVRDGLMGPIAPEAVEALAEWAAAIRDGRPPREPPITDE